MAADALMDLARTSYCSVHDDQDKRHAGILLSGVRSAAGAELLVEDAVELGGVGPVRVQGHGRGV